LLSAALAAGVARHGLTLTNWRPVLSRGQLEKTMYAVEFQAKIKDGTIVIPELYRNRFKERVRVILLAEEENTGETFIDQLLQHPLKVAGFKPLAREAIYERP
jgi:hypothetical protein